jgi:hypothetical protein
MAATRMRVVKDRDGAVEGDEPSCTGGEFFDFGAGAPAL